MSATAPAIASVQCLRIEGADARRFAQAQFAGNVDALAVGAWQWNAWLTASGRVAALMQLVDVGDQGLLAVLRGGEVETIRAGLARYLLRMQASLTIQSCTAHAGAALPAGTARREAEITVLGLGMRSLRLDPAPAQTEPSAALAWRRADILAGWPQLPPGEPRFLPPALGLDRLGAVALDKGCYPGQEIVARLHYRGGHKYQLCRLQGDAALAVGELQLADRETRVTILDAVTEPGRTDALAVIPCDLSGSISTLQGIYPIHANFPG